jgi:hypothetical protein
MRGKQMFKLEFETDNAAFGDDASEEAAEMARVIYHVATRVLAGYRTGVCVDSNGNIVGEWTCDFPSADDD